MIINLKAQLFHDILWYDVWSDCKSAFTIPLMSKKQRLHRIYQLLLCNKPVFWVYCGLFCQHSLSGIDTCLTHWGRVTYICVRKLTIIGSDNGLSPGRRQAIIWTNAGILLIQTPGTNFSETLSELHTVSFKKMHLKMSAILFRPQCVKNLRPHKPMGCNHPSVP